MLVLKNIYIQEMTKKLNFKPTIQGIFLGLLLFLVPFSLLFAPPPPSFAAQQLFSVRVKQAKDASDAALKKLFTSKGLAYPAKHIFWRVFKSENVMELWAADQANQAMTLIKTYPVCSMSGELGPKRKQGDNQVPEGFYYIDHYNTYSAYHLSLRINYPNAADRAHQRNGSMGGDIYIHGDCVSIGCMAMTTPAIKEIYWLSVQARNNGQERIPVHVFPARLSDFKMNILRQLYQSFEPEMVKFWENLQPGYRAFQQTHQVPRVAVGDGGKYTIQ